MPGRAFQGLGEGVAPTVDNLESKQRAPRLLSVGATRREEQILAKLLVGLHDVAVLLPEKLSQREVCQGEGWALRRNALKLAAGTFVVAHGRVERSNDESKMKVVRPLLEHRLGVVEGGTKPAFLCTGPEQ
jgi:hypothetical protein